MSKATKALEADTALDEFRKVGNDFGIGDDIADSLTAIIDDLDACGKKWADETAADWATDGTPWQTENLVNSIDFSAECPNYTVGVNLDLLLGPKQLPAQRSPWLGMVDIPDYDYTEEADKQAVSGYGAGFIKGLWNMIADRNANRIFGR